MPIKPPSIKHPWSQQRQPSFKNRAVLNTDFYNSSTWRITSKAYRSAHPFCECSKCSIALVPLPANIVDHKVPITKGGDPFNWDNLQAMSTKCHNQKSGRESHGKYDHDNK